MGNFRRDLPCCILSTRTPSGVVDLAPIYNAHEKLGLAGYALRKHFFNLFSARTVLEKGNEGARVKHDSLHSWRSWRRPSFRNLRADGSPLREPRRLRIYSRVSGCKMSRVSSSIIATRVPLRIPYFRRSFEGITNWPLVVTVETTLFMGAPIRAQTISISVQKL